VFYIQKGRVKLTVVSDQGKEAVVAILEPAQFFGEGCMKGDKLRTSTTTAMENCVITAIAKAAMIAAIHDEPKFSELFMAHLLTRNSRIEEDLIDPAIQFKRAAACAAAFAACEFRQGRQPAADQSQRQRGNVGGDDRHHPIPSQPIHEQVSQAGPHQLQWANRGQQLAIECGFA
jgi:CRP-like cAMP-binding protein